MGGGGRSMTTKFGETVAKVSKQIFQQLIFACSAHPSLIYTMSKFKSLKILPRLQQCRRDREGTFAPGRFLFYSIHLYVIFVIGGFPIVSIYIMAHNARSICILSAGQIHRYPV